MLSDILDHGDLGKKTGKGFYTYSKGKKTGINKKLLKLVQKLPPGTSRDRSVPDRLITLMVDEAKQCLEEGISTEEDIDFAMVMGTGWIPFKGGPLTYSENL